MSRLAVLAFLLLLPVALFAQKPVTLEEDVRAVSVEIAEVIAPAGPTEPGARIDMFALPGADTKLVLQDVRVLTVRKAANQQGQRVAVATLLVSEEQARKLAAAEGRVRLVVRAEAGSS